MERKITRLKNFLLTLVASMAVAVTQAQTVQVIHNSPGAPAVNVLINGSTVAGLVEVPFRAASPFLSLNAGVTTVQIAVASSGAIVSTDVITLTSGISYRAIATGLVGSTVPGRGFKVDYSVANLSTSNGNTQLDIIHSSPDAPTVGVVARGVTTLVSSFSYLDAPTSVSVPSSTYTIDVNAGNASGATVASYTAPLGLFSGQSIAVIASGFYPFTFGLIAVDVQGNVVTLASPANVQVIHNSPGAPNVNVLINGSTVAGLLNVPFRNASPFLALNAGTTTVQIAVASSGDIVSTDVITLTSGISYRAIATGVVGSTVSGQGFTVDYSVATVGNIPGNTVLDIYHSSPNAPSVGVVARGVTTLVSSFSFLDVATTVTVPAASYTLDINANDASGTTVASFTAPLSSFSGKSLAVIASGLFPSTFGLIAIDADGNVVQLSTVTSLTSNESDAKGIRVYPNPASDIMEIETPWTGDITYQLVGSTGAVFGTSKTGTINVNTIPSGIYVLQVLENGVLKANKKVVVQ